MLKEKIINSKRLYPLYLLYLAVSPNKVLKAIQGRKKPQTIQLPITSRCNSRCQTCNVWKDRERVDIDPHRLSDIFSDQFFSDVINVGINGGEVTLVKNFADIIGAVLTLPSLRNIYIISNGLLPNKLLPLLKDSKAKCAEKGVKLHFTLSVDGYKETHEAVRGIPNCFERTRLILDTFKAGYSEYADSVAIGSTLSKGNIAQIQETKVFLDQYPFKVQFHLAVPNRRIHTFDEHSYCVWGDEHATMLAAEFFYSEFLKANGPGKYSAFCQYYFLRNGGKGRLCTCNYKYQDITIDENLYLYLCATASPKVCDLNNVKIGNAFKTKEYKDAISFVKNQCEYCIHYISETPTVKGWFIFIKELIRLRFDWVNKFKILSR